MKEEDTLRFAFRFTRGELAALCKLVGSEGMPDLEIAAAAPDEETVQGLMESGSVLAAGDRVLADNIVVFLLREICGSECRLVMTGPGGKAVLYRGSKIWIMAEENGEIITLEPLSDKDHARRSCQEVSERLGEPLQGMLAKAEGKDSRASGTDTPPESAGTEEDGIRDVQDLFEKMP